MYRTFSFCCWKTCTSFFTQVFMWDNIVCISFPRAGRKAPFSRLWPQVLLNVICSSSRDRPHLKPGCLWTAGALTVGFAPGNFLVIRLHTLKRYHLQWQLLECFLDSWILKASRCNVHPRKVTCQSQCIVYTYPSWLVRGRVLAHPASHKGKQPFT